MNADSSSYLDILHQKSEPILYEDDDWFVLFAKKPSNEGHLLLIPKIKEHHFFNLPPDILRRGFEIATELSKLLNEIYTPPRVAVYIKGFTNDDHIHIHVIPVYKTTDLDVNPSARELSAEEMFALALKLQSPIQGRLNSYFANSIAS